MEPVSFSKGPICGHCKKSENCDLMSCSRCRLAKYCSMDCQKNDFSNHKNDCQWVGHFQEMMPKIEKLYSNWDGGENIFETQGEYTAWKANRSLVLFQIKLRISPYRNLSFFKAWISFYYLFGEKFLLSSEKFWFFF